ncbi:MAG TPA: GAF domain-containing protein [Blastococcus sp.]|jgi:GAF domain-containing protein|nr:GAF domain-containing protein [Blastococcus sp.]
MVPPRIADVAPWRDWTAALDGLLEFLHEHIGWDVWMVTRVVDDCQIVLRSSPAGSVPAGSRLPWEESFCREMVEGRAPRIATVTAAVPAYAARTKGLAHEVSAYLGVPLVTPDGQLFGTVCGVAFRAKPLSATRELPLVEIVARMLSTLLSGGLPPPPLPEPRTPTR